MKRGCFSSLWPHGSTGNTQYEETTQQKTGVTFHEKKKKHKKTDSEGRIQSPEEDAESPLELFPGIGALTRKLPTTARLDFRNAMDQ